MAMTREDYFNMSRRRPQWQQALSPSTVKWMAEHPYSHALCQAERLGRNRRALNDIKGISNK